MSSVDLFVLLKFNMETRVSGFIIVYCLSFNLIFMSSVDLFVLIKLYMETRVSGFNIIRFTYLT